MFDNRRPIIRINSLKNSGQNSMLQIGAICKEYVHNMHRRSGDIHPRLVHCWPTVYDAGPALNQP